MSGGRGSDDVVAAPRANECLRHACSSTCGGTCEGAPIAYGAFHHYQHAVQQWGKGTGASALLVIEAAAAGAPRQKTTVYELYYIQCLTKLHSIQQLLTSRISRCRGVCCVRRHSRQRTLASQDESKGSRYLSSKVRHKYIHTYMHTHIHTHTQAVFQGITPRI